MVTSLLRASIPLSKVNSLRLTDHRHMFDLVPFIAKDEEGRLKNERNKKHFSDETTRLDEALAVVVHFVGEQWTL